MPGNGVVAKGPETSRPQYLLHLSSIHIPSNTIEIILQVSNYALNLGGPYRAILLLMFFAELFPEERTVKALRFTQVTAVLAILTVIIFPARISNLTLVPYEIFAILNIAFVLHILIPAVMNKRKDALLFLSGVLIFFASATNEILALKLNKKNKALSRSIQRLRYSYRALKDNIILKAALETQKQREEKVRLKVEKEALEKFRYQLNPHFLFNALASIRGAVSVDADVARDMVTRLSEYCRLTLDQGKKESVTIRESIEINKLYLEMEGLRLGDYLTVSISAPSDILNRKIPTNLLQPLVENAVKYGRLTSPDALSVRVIFKDGSKGRILLEVANTGAWMDPDSPDHPDTTGIGLENIQQQLSRLYPDDHCFSTREENGWVKVFIGMPTSMASVFQQRKEGV